MNETFKKWQETDGRETIGELDLSVGVPHGPVVVGDVGTVDRLEIAVLGNTVNVASRLEGATRELGCSCLVSNDPILACKLEHTSLTVKLLEHLPQAHSINLKEGGSAI